MEQTTSTNAATNMIPVRCFKAVKKTLRSNKSRLNVEIMRRQPDTKLNTPPHSLQVIVRKEVKKRSH